MRSPESAPFRLLQTPPRVRLANFYPFKAGERAGPHWSESDLYLPITQGQGALQVGPRRFVLSAGQVLHVPWAAPLLYEADRNDPFVAIGLHFSYASWDESEPGRPLHVSRQIDMARASMQVAPGPQPYAEPFVVVPLPHSTLLELGAELARAYERPQEEESGDARTGRLRGLALAFLAEFQACAQRGAQLGDNPGGVQGGSGATAAQMRLVREVASYMDLRLTGRVKRGELAERANVSESTLAAAFRAVTGLAPMDYLIERRLARARQHLATGRTPVAEIAARVGIPDVFYFSKLFRRRVGCSPREYRNRRRL
jgi:AraC-like DNA-binding protein